LPEEVPLAPPGEIEGREVAGVFERLGEIRERARKPFVSARAILDAGRKR
jgi:hypothetical protein